jgi:hypothetical protein
MTESGKSDVSYCISCGEKIKTGTEYCPVCGSTQDPQALESEHNSTANSSNEPTTVDDDVWTSWAIGFKPADTIRNLVVGILYFVFYWAGIPLLLYAYIKKENPDESGYYAIGRVSLIVFAVIYFLFGAAALMGRAIPAGLFYWAGAVIFTPPVWDKVEQRISINFNWWKIISTGVLIFFIGITLTALTGLQPPP